MKRRAYLGGAFWKVCGICQDGKCPDDDHEPNGSPCINIFSRCGRGDRGPVWQIAQCNCVVSYPLLWTDRQTRLNTLPYRKLCVQMVINPHDHISKQMGQGEVWVYSNQFYFRCRCRNVHLVDHNTFYVFFYASKTNNNWLLPVLVVLNVVGTIGGFTEEGAGTSRQPKFLYFYAVFGNWPNNRSAPLPLGLD